ncbi:REP element-mobilizing transposase RayT [Sinorhizobium kostiense]|uniref:REP element-mobilizing transposase RayT n=1 Tax=Sinorhizobium kostiense TaxID=76747 RepID=A0ABS4QZ21_9HYPH|nr:transposase [Sinorhizobium kostiense]MBP2235334.1 REP element-mobilizing transposase RayT [Sinorhizobium kostiense]
MSVKRKVYSIKLQVVYAIAYDIASLLPEEVEVIGDALRSGARKFRCDIISTSSGDRWFEAVLAAEPSFDIPKAMTSLKTVSSRAINARRGSNAGFWAPGYVVVSIGEAVNPEEAAKNLESRGIRK